MRSTITRWLLITIGGICLLNNQAKLAEASDANIIILEPGRYNFVNGDYEKYRAHHWLQEGYSGGIREFSFKQTLKDGFEMQAEAHAIVDNNDISASLSLTRGEDWFMNLHFSEFRKYYDGTGGSFYRFTNLGTVETDKDLRLDIGKFELETGFRIAEGPEITLEYEREFRKGAKSRLTWGTENASTFGLAKTSRKTIPAWQEIDEVVDVFAVKVKQEVAGFTLKGEQSWEFVRIESLRQEQYISDGGGSNLIRRQNLAPETDLMTTLLGGERWFLDDKLFVASGYRFGHMDNREMETLAEFTPAGVPTGSNENRFSARADNDYDTHTWVENFQFKPVEWLAVTARIKAEVIKRESNSTYPLDNTSPPDGITNRTEVSLNNNKATRFGEGLFFRFTNIPRTALYTELELEQSRVLLREDRKSLAGQSGASADEIFSRETVTDIDRGVVTLGGRVVPWSLMDLTTHLRHRWNDTDYDDQRETSPGSSTARSAFFDGQSVKTNEITTKLMVKPCRWFKPSLRHQFRNDNYATRAENEPIVKTNMLSHIYTADLTLQPLRDLTTTLSFSRQNAVTSTPARLSSSANYLPTFHADVESWLMSTEYLPKPNVTLTSALYYTIAENFNDFSLTGMPYGVDNERLDVDTAVTWVVKEGTSVKTAYQFSRYQPHSKAESGANAYDAHSLWLELNKKF